MTGMANAMSSADKEVLVLADGKKIADDENKKYTIKHDGLYYAEYKKCDAD